jgi:hypothetical protein
MVEVCKVPQNQFIPSLSQIVYAKGVLLYDDYLTWSKTSNRLIDAQIHLIDDSLNDVIEKCNVMKSKIKRKED